MQTIKKFCEENNLDSNRVFEMVLGESEGILPKARGYTGYFAEITDSGIICTNDTFEVKKEIPFSSFTAAEFGIGSGLLWLQCVVNGKSFIFTSPRKNWKSPAGRLLVEKIGAHTEILGQAEYKRYMGKLFWLYALIR